MIKSFIMFSFFLIYFCLYKEKPVFYHSNIKLIKIFSIVLQFLQNIYQVFSHSFDYKVLIAIPTVWITFGDHESRVLGVTDSPISEG